MGDMTDMYVGMRNHYKGLRKRYGVPCPQCPTHRPKAQPSILLPQQKCKVDGYVDPRPRIKDVQP